MNTVLILVTKFPAQWVRKSDRLSVERSNMTGLWEDYEYSHEHYRAEIYECLSPMVGLFGEGLTAKKAVEKLKDHLQGFETNDQEDFTFEIMSKSNLKGIYQDWILKAN